MDPYYDHSKEIAELESLRTKLVQLHDSFTPFLQVTSPNYPYPVQWPEVLNKFNVLVARYVGLNRALADQQLSSLRKLILHPNEPVNSDHEQLVMSVLLRTKLTPDVEQAQDALVMDAETTDTLGVQRGLSEKTTTGNVQAEELKLWKAKAEAYDAICLSTEQSMKRYLEEYRSNLKLRIVDENDNEDTGDGLTASVSSTTRGPKPLGLLPAKAGPLEELMSFTSSGPPLERRPVG
ncbi:hypothetical protein IWQ62_005025 [Dispira parvispora]|uniref:Mediator of RNA polymerase II transcription subunit 8 n=1 Tax=Dispira parvispora TaxID=1520584 RepID=A0A9W8ARL3_9FUNG|nr:hypothetical protein IWQ62_005025 [Dispira parvispora]